MSEDLSSPWQGRRKGAQPETASRRAASRTAFAAACAEAAAYGMCLTCHTEAHYSLMHTGHEWRLHLYPGTQRVLADRHKARPPRLDLPQPWTISDAVKAAIQADGGRPAVSQHTPGPWSFRRAVCTEGGKPSWRGNYAVCSSPETGLNLATVWGDMIPDDARPAEANARLIAAAPKMFAVCECQKAIDDVFDGLITEDEYVAILTRHGWDGANEGEFFKRLLVEALNQAEGGAE